MTRWSIWFLLALPLAAHAQNKEDALRTRLEQAAAATTLEDPSLKPWHLKMAVTLNDGPGGGSRAGTIEQWWAAPDTWRLTYTLPDTTITELHVDGKAYVSRNTAPEPYHLSVLHDQVVHPIRTASFEGRRLDLRPIKAGTVGLECILLVASSLRLDTVPMGLAPSDCFDPGSTSLRLQSDTSGENILRNAVGTFQEKRVATQMVIAEGSKTLAEGKLSALATLPRASMPLTVTEDLEEILAEPTKVSGAVVAASVLSKTQPAYPDTARRDHIQGDVVLRALISRDGVVRSLEVMSAPRADLAVSALVAVRTWRYKPYLLNGTATDVDTTITVKYSFGPG